MKLKKSIPILMIFLVLIISIGAISAADDDSGNETLAVNEVAADDNLKESPTDTLSEVENKTFTDLNTDIADKTVADLESNYVYSDGDSAYANGITIDRELTINGNGKTTLNPNGNLLFKVGTHGKLTLNDLTIVNSYTSPDAMIQNSGTLILNNVTFTVERHILSSAVSNSKFITIQNDGELLVNNSVFKDSYIYSDHISSSSKNMYIYGLIYNTNQTTIENTIFDNNKLVNPSDNKLGKTIDICAVLHNKQNMTLNNVTIKNTDVSYAPAGSTPHFEGIIFNELGKLEINSSIIKDNNIYFTSTNSNLKGIIYSESTTSELIISNSIIVNNTNMQTTNVKTIIESKGSADLDNNYWGTNNPDFTSLISSTTPTKIVTLNFTPEELTTGVEKTFDITFKVNDAVITTLPNYVITVNSKKLGSKDVEIKKGVGEYKYLPITAGEDTITINGEEYTITVNAAPAGSFTDLNDLIIGNDEIELYRDYIYQSSDSTFASGIPINKKIIINANGYTLNANGQSLFDIGSEGNIILNNATIINNYSKTDAMIKNNGTLILDNIVFTIEKNINGVAGTYKNIENSGKLTILNSNFKDCNYTNNIRIGTSATNYYGLIYNTNELNIENTIFDNNNFVIASEYAIGRTIAVSSLIYNDGGNVLLNNSKVTNNKVNYTSTSLPKFNAMIQNNEGILTITNSSFENNDVNFDSANSNFKGIIDSSKSLTISNSIFKDNTVQNSIINVQGTGNTINNNLFINNTDKIIDATSSTDININKNYWGTNSPDFGSILTEATPENYVIIKIDGDENLLPESVVEYTVNFKTNDSEAICEMPDYTIDLSATNTLSDNSVTISKGTASFTYFATLDEIEDTIKATIDSVEKANLTVNIKEDPTAKGTFKELDRFIRKTNDTLDLIKDYTFDAGIDAGLETGFTIDKNLTINGHGFKINGTDLAKLFIITANGNLTLKDVVMATDYVFTGTYNNARPESSIKNLGTLTFDNVTFTLNQNVNSIEKAFAAGIYNTNKFNIINSKFVDSTIHTNTQYCFGYIDNNGGTLNIENTLFDGNSMIDNSTMSSTYLDGLIYNMGTLTLNNVNMTNNYMETPNNGRGLIRAYTNSKITIDNSIFENNTVKSKTNNAAGTVIYAESGSMTIANSKFTNNTGALSGGAVYSGIAITFENNTFEKNNASSYGGAIYGGSSSIYINNTFKENKAEQGGALYTGGSLQSSSSYLFTENTFIDNYASKYGGAIYSGAIGTAQYPIDNNVFINNEALEKGGAIYSSGGVRVINTLFQENTAGEGVAIYTSSSTACQISYTIFDNNIITSPTGGLLYIRGTSTVEDNYWGTNTPNFEDLIKVSGGTLTAPTSIVIIVIEGNETLSDSDNYVVKFKNNNTGDIVALYNYTVDITSDLNTVTPTSVVISEGETIFRYNAVKSGDDTIRVSKNNDEITNLTVNVNIPVETPEFTIVANNVTYGESLNFTFTIIKGPTGANVYKWTISDNESELESGFITENNEIEYANTYNAGNYTIKVELKDAKGWMDLTVNDTFEVKVAQSEVEISKVSETIIYPGSVNITYTEINGTATITVKDAQGNNVTFTKEPGKIILTNLAAGTYTVNATIPNNDNIKGSTDKITFTVEKDTSSVSITPVSETITYPGAVNITYTETKGIATITVKDAQGNNVTFTKEPDKIVLTNLAAGTYTVNATIPDNDNITGSTAEITFAVNKTTSEVKITPLAETVTYSHDVNLTYSEINGTATITVKDAQGNDVPFTTEPGKIILTNLAVGTYTVNATINDDDNVTGSSDKIIFHVAKEGSDVFITPVSETITYPGAVNITYTETNGTAIITVKDTQGNNVTFTKEPGKIILTNLAAGTYTVNATIVGHEGLEGSSDEITFNVNQATSEVSIAPVTGTITYPGNVNITYTENNGIATITVKDANGNDVTFTTEPGKIILTNLAAGTYTVNATIPDNDNIIGSTAEITFTVNKSASEVSIAPVTGTITYPGNVNITYTETNGIATITVKDANGNDVTFTTEPGKIVLTNLAAGTYTVNATIPETGNIKGSSDQITFTVSKEVIPIENVTSMNIPEGTTSPEFTITLPSEATGNFTVTVDGTPYTEALVNGTATVKVPELTVGNHTISTAYSGDEKYEGFTSDNKTVDIPKASIPGGDSILNPTTPEGSDSPSFSINLTGATGNLTVTVDGVNYTKALENGSATVNVPKLSAGTHNITVTYSGDAKFSSISKNITYNVTEPVVKITNNKDITMLYSAKTTFKVLVTVDGKAVDANEIVKIRFNGKTYKVKTDKNGYASFKLPTVKPKKAKYTITAEYKGVKVSNKVKVNSIIKAKNLKVKKSKKVNKIKVTLKKVNKKYLKGKTLKLKIKGKTLKAKTNKKGVATFKVKKNVLKKLKVGKKYKYKVTYGKDTVTKKLTIKK